MKSPARNNPIAEIPKIAKLLAASNATSGFARNAEIKPNCKLATIGTKAIKTSAKSRASITGINVKAIKIAKITKNGTMTQIVKMFGTLIPSVANASTKMITTPSNNTNQT